MGVLAEIVKPDDGHADDDNDAVLGCHAGTSTARSALARSVASVFRVASQPSPSPIGNGASRISFGKESVTSFNGSPGRATTVVRRADVNQALAVTHAEEEMGYLNGLKQILVEVMRWYGRHLRHSAQRLDWAARPVVEIKIEVRRFGSGASVRQSNENIT